MLQNTTVIVAFLAILAVPVRADEVKLKNGATFKGRIVSEAQGRLILETAHGMITLRRSQVKEVVRAPWKPPVEIGRGKSRRPKTGSKKKTTRRPTRRRTAPRRKASSPG